MPFMKDYERQPGKAILAIGYPGAGKSKQICTLPGKKFAYVFERQALESIAGAKDLEYEMFIPSHREIDMAVKTLKKGRGDPPSMKNLEPRVYEDWSDDFIQRAEDGFFDDIDWLIFDSFTTWSYSILDRLLWLNKRTGKQPEQDDWAAQVNHISNMFRVITSLPCRIYCTGHMEMKQNDKSKKTYNHLLMTGQLRTRIPLLFSDIWIFSADSDSKGAFYQVQTVPDRENPTARCSIEGLQMFEDVTLDFSRPLEGQGVAELLTFKPALEVKKKVKK